MNVLIGEGLYRFLMILFSIFLIIIAWKNIVNYMILRDSEKYEAKLSISALITFNLIFGFLSLFFLIHNLFYLILILMDKYPKNEELPRFPGINEETRMSINEVLTNELIEAAYNDADFNVKKVAAVDAAVSEEEAERAAVDAAVSEEEAERVATQFVRISGYSRIKEILSDENKTISFKIYISKAIPFVFQENFNKLPEEKKDEIFEKVINKITKDKTFEIYKYMGVDKNEAIDISKSVIIDNLRKEVLNGQITVREYLFTDSYKNLRDKIKEKKEQNLINEKEVRSSNFKVKNINDSIKKIGEKLELLEQGRYAGRYRKEDLEYTLENLFQEKIYLENKILKLNHNSKDDEIIKALKIDNPNKKPLEKLEELENKIKALKIQNEGVISENNKIINDNQSEIRKLENESNIKFDFRRFKEFVENTELSKTEKYFKMFKIYLFDKFYPEGVDTIQDIKLSTIRNLSGPRNTLLYD